MEFINGVHYKGQSLVFSEELQVVSLIEEAQLHNVADAIELYFEALLHVELYLQIEARTHPSLLVQKNHVLINDHYYWVEGSITLHPPGLVRVKFGVQIFCILNADLFHEGVFQWVVLAYSQMIVNILLSFCVISVMHEVVQLVFYAIHSRCLRGCHLILLLNAIPLFFINQLVFSVICLGPIFLVDHVINKDL